jgi:enoyl-CoA hydratase
MVKTMGHESAVVLTEKEGAVAIVRLSRPQVVNAINDDVRTHLPAAMRACEVDPEVRVIILAGEGPRGFCAGADIKEARGEEAPVATRRRLVGTAYVDAFDNITKPIVAAIHGACMGGGFEIALACDIRMASPDAVFGLPETGLGLIPGAGGTQRLPRIVGLGRALDLLLTGERIGAQEAHRIGIVSRLAASRESLLQEARELATAIAAKPPIATAYAKEAARTGIEIDLKAGLALEKALFSMLSSTEDKKEAAAAFAEKRQPQFKNC